MVEAGHARDVALERGELVDGADERFDVRRGSHNACYMQL
jgi:hypothetical protein